MGLLVDETAAAFDATMASETADNWLGDALDVVTQQPVVTLDATLSESIGLLQHHMPRPDTSAKHISM